VEEHSNEAIWKVVFAGLLPEHDTSPVLHPVTLDLHFKKIYLKWYTDIKI
jgi:hypothetical protein